MNSRRSFLIGLASSILVPPIYEEVAKGRSFLSLYSPKILRPTESQIAALELEKVLEKLPSLFEFEDRFYSILEVPRPILYELYTQEIRIPLESK